MTKIGLETHVQLNSKSKLFCGCANPIVMGKAPEELVPNSVTCETCLGMPGSKPRLNRAVIEMALKVALALNCKPAAEMFFSRKTYFYPDMSKNFQITQYEIPIAALGFLEILGDDGKPKKISIRRLQIEEDPARLVHVGGLGSEGSRFVLVDYNRSGIPLIEIVTDPDFASSEEARRYLNKLISILEYLGVYQAISPAVLKSDANVSVEGGERVEVKNITGTVEIEKALNYEITRQHNELRRGNKIIRETRGWDPGFGATRAMRLKEEEAEYGYIFEPDLTKIEITKATVEKLRAALPELPDAKEARFIKQYKISETLAEALVSDIAIANLFERAASKVDAKIAASWIAGPLLKTLNWNKLTWETAGVREDLIIAVIIGSAKGTLTKTLAEQAIRDIVEKKIKQIRVTVHAVTTEELETTIEGVLDTNKKAVADYKAGQQKALEFLVGQMIRNLKGKIDANFARELLMKKLG